MYLPVNIPSGVSLVVWRALWCIFGENKRPRVYPVSCILGGVLESALLGSWGFTVGKVARPGWVWGCTSDGTVSTRECILGSLWGRVGFKVVYPGWLPCRHWAPALAAAAGGTHRSPESPPTPCTKEGAQKKKHKRDLSQAAPQRGTLEHTLMFQ